MKKNNNETMSVNEKNHKNKKGMSTMTEKIYKAKGSATRAINKAVKNGEYMVGELVTCEVEGGFQILINREARPMEFCDEELEARWHELVCQILPNVEDGEETLGFVWFIFQPETTFAEIFAWFDNEYSEGLETLKCKHSYFNLPSDEKVDERAKTIKRDSLTAKQKSALNALVGVKALVDKSDDERAGVWFPFSEIYNSTTPADLPPRSMGGIMGGLINRGLIRFVADGKEYIGKKAVAVCLTNEGLEAIAA